MSIWHPPNAHGALSACHSPRLNFKYKVASENKSATHCNFFFKKIRVAVINNYQLLKYRESAVPVTLTWHRQLG